MDIVFQEHILKNRTAFITGGTSGINLTIAESFVRHGARVAVVGRNPAKLEAAVAHLRTVGEATGYAADVREYDALEGAMKTAAGALGPFDIVVAGAAGNFPAPVLGMSANGFKSVVDIDLRGTFNAFRAAFEHCVRPGASMIAISATQAWIPTALQAHVCAAKAGIEMLVKTLALEWGPMGVRVNSIAPGPIDDTEGMARLTPTPEAKDALAGTIPLRRYGTKQEIAEIALFLCSHAARYITGTCIVADGGQALVGSGAFTMAMER